VKTWKLLEVKANNRPSACFAALLLAAALNVAAQTQSPVVFQRSAVLRTASGGNLVPTNLMSDPSVIFENGKYRMWFTTVAYPYTANQQAGISYAESLDGVVWQTRMEASTRQPQLVLSPTPGGWDSGGVETPAVVKAPDGKYLLYYSGVLPPAGSHKWAIGMASSIDGITWTKVGTAPILQGRGGWEGPYTTGSVTVGGVAEPSVVYDPVQKLYKMWYSGTGVQNDMMAFRIGYAISSDGRNWSAQPSPVLNVSSLGKWDDLVVSHVNVAYDSPSSTYHMFYFGTSAQKYSSAEAMNAAMVPGSIGHATSRDGVTWTRSSGPVLQTVANTWEGWMIGGPCAVIVNDSFKLFYFGSQVYNSYSLSMGLATAAIPR
jgi:predicted GH43/DUF377 family glycosyl hydrolase